MEKWYKAQINQMIEKINDEHFLKQLFIIINNHVQKKD